MAWTYSGDPSASSKDAVRFLSGDTSSGDAFVSDEEISYTLSEENSNAYRAAALICEGLAAKFASEPDTKIGDLSLTGSQISKRFEERGTALRKRNIAKGVSLFIGGISRTAKDSEESNSDRVEPAFSVGMFDVGSHSTGST